jgi:hypothetical protein
MRGDEVQGPTGRVAGFRWRAEEEIEVDANPRLGENSEGALDLVEAGALCESVKNLLIRRFQAKLQHDASRGGEPPAKFRVGQER